MTTTPPQSPLPDLEAADAWAKRQVDKAPPATAEQLAAVRRALMPERRHRSSA